jgi:hypothetical protein
MSEPERKRRTLDLGGVKPEPVKKSPPAKQVKAIAEDSGFTSREPADSHVDVAPEPAPVAAPIRKRVGARKKGRTEALNIRVKPEVYNEVRDICDVQDYGYAEFFIEALEAWREKHGQDG